MMQDDHDIEKLTTTAVFDASQKPATDLWPECEDIDDFLTFVRIQRNDAPAASN